MRRRALYLILSAALAMALAALPLRAAEQWYEDTYETEEYNDQADTNWDDYEWDPSGGLHEEEWYDPSDWFDDDEGIEYEDYGTPGAYDDYGYYGYGTYGYDYGDYGYDYDLYDGYPNWDYGADYGTGYNYGDDYGYGWDFDLDGENNFYTDDWYETNDSFGDWYETDWYEQNDWSQ